jgi:hypothetical protein
MYDILKRHLRFYEIAIGAQCVCTGLVFGLTERGQHNDLNILEAFGIAKDIKHLKATNTRHHHIRDDEVWSLLLGLNKGFFAVLSRNNRVTLGLQARFVDLAQVIIVFNQEDFCHGSVVPFIMLCAYGYWYCITLSVSR